MDAIDLFLVRFGETHRAVTHDVARLPDTHVRGRPHPGVNTVAWLVWHAARVEDVGVNRFVTDGRQVLHDGWLERLGVARRDVGTGMSDAEVDTLSAAVDLGALRGYWDAVARRTLEVAETLRAEDLSATVPVERVHRTAGEQGAVAPGAEWLTEFWAKGRTRAWMLTQTALLHPYGHYFEARTVAGLWGVRSP